MGGYFSTRWRSRQTKRDTDPCLFLDVRRLHRDGALEPGAARWQQWTRRGEPSGSIVTAMNTTGDTITLIYQTSRHGGHISHIRDPIRIERTPCNYGGSRPWFTCPGCLKRCAVLYSPDGYFRCRACHKLAYTSTREDELERSIRRADTLRKRIGDTSSGYVFRAPRGGKPAGMHWDTYTRIRGELDAELDQMSGLFADGIEAITGRVGALDRAANKGKQQR